MPDKEWYTQKEIADMLGVDIKKVWPAVATLRRTGVIRTAEDPQDERVMLVHASAIDAIKRALRVS
ncbi:MAG: hypothetical protein H0X24_02685 [Ktedonobacterales bacterium]|nr:hypothetical protein [Ktedonobacterales bacterium]